MGGKARIKQTGADLVGHGEVRESFDDTRLGRDCIELRSGVDVGAVEADMDEGSGAGDAGDAEGRARGGREGVSEEGGGHGRGGLWWGMLGEKGGRWGIYCTGSAALDGSSGGMGCGQTLAQISLRLAWTRSLARGNVHKLRAPAPIPIGSVHARPLAPYPAPCPGPTSECGVSPLPRRLSVEYQPRPRPIASSKFS